MKEIVTTTVVAVETQRGKGGWDENSGDSGDSDDEGGDSESDN